MSSSKDRTTSASVIGSSEVRSQKIRSKIVRQSRTSTGTSATSTRTPYGIIYVLLARTDTIFLPR